MSEPAEATPEMIAIGMGALASMGPAALQARMGAVVGAIMESLVTGCQCEPCKTLQGVFQGITLDA